MDAGEQREEDLIGQAGHDGCAQIGQCDRHCVNAKLGKTDEFAEEQSIRLLSEELNRRRKENPPQDLYNSHADFGGNEDCKYFIPND